MKHATRTLRCRFTACGVVFNANADVITDWNIKAGEIVTESKLGTPPAIRAMAIVQTAVYDAVNAVATGASINAAVAAANRVTLTKLMPAQQASIDAAYQAALAQIADGPAKTAGIAAGEQAAAAVLARRADDGAATAGVISAAHDRGRLRADGHACGHAVAAAQAVADEQARRSFGRVRRRR